MKCNTDGASKGNSGESVYGFCIRNKTGDLIYAQLYGIDISMNIEAKAKAIQEALRFSAINSLQNMVIKNDSLTLKNIVSRYRKYYEKLQNSWMKYQRSTMPKCYSSIYFQGGHSSGGLFS